MLTKKHPSEDEKTKNKQHSRNKDGIGTDAAEQIVGNHLKSWKDNTRKHEH